MANRTVKDAKSIHGTNPQYLIEKIIRSRIYDSKYWKEECFALTAELLVDKAMELRFVGGVFGGNVRPTPFLCLTLKMLQIQPEKDIVVEFIKNDEFKYVRALGAYYLRLTGTSLDCYNYLEPLLNDSRKLRRQNRSGAFELVFMDDFVDELLTEDRVCDVILPRLQKRYVLEQNNELQPRISVLEDDEDDEDLEEMEEGETADDKPSSSAKSKEDKSSKTTSSRHTTTKRHHSDSSDDEYRRRKDRRREDRSHSPDSSRRRDRDRERDRDRGDRERDREHSRRDRDRGDRDRSRDRDRARRSRSKERDYDRRYDDSRSSGRRDDRDRRDRDRDRDRHRGDRDHDRDRERDRHRSSRHDY